MAYLKLTDALYYQLDFTSTLFAFYRKTLNSENGARKYIFIKKKSIVRMDYNKDWEEKDAFLFFFPPT